MTSIPGRLLLLMILINSMCVPASVVIPPLIQLGDENTELTHLPSNGSVPQIDLLAGSPPPSTYHTPLTPTTDPTIGMM